jgi:hypothetical protein
MIKKIFSYIIIGIFLLLPNLSFAKIIEIKTISVNNYDITSNSVKVFGTIRQQKNADGGNPSVPPPEIHAGFTVPQKSSQNITSCSTQLPKPQLSKLTISKVEDNDTELIYFYSLNKTFTNLQPGETYYFCFAGIEGKDNKDSNQYTYGSVKSFSTQPTLELSVNSATEKTQINYGGSVQVKWDSQGSNLCIGRNDLSFINGPTSYGSQGVAPTGNKTIDKIYERKVYTIECISKSGYGSITKSVEVTIKGKDENSIGKVSTLPTDKNTEPELTVEVTDKSAKLQGNLSALFENKNPEHCKNGVKDENETGTDIGGSCTGAYAYFRISKVTIPPLFCNDIFGSNMIAVTATNQGNTKIPGGKLKNAGDFYGTIYTLEPDTDYAYCAIVSNHPITPTEIEYGQVVRFRTNPCLNCPHTTVRTLRPTKITNSSAVLQGNFNSTRNIKVWFEYRPKWGGLNVPIPNQGETTELEDTCKNGIKDGDETGIDIGGACGTGQSGFLEKNLKNRLLGITNYQSIEIGLDFVKKYIKKEIVNAANEPIITNEWHTIKDSESIYSKKRNYGRKQFTLTGLSRDTIYQYRIVAKTIPNKALYPNPNPEQTFEGAIVEFRTKSVGEGVNPLAHCYNGIQDLGETGVDTGGGCPGKAPSCDDGIQNQNETGIDQGGVCKDNSLNHCLNGIQDFGETGVDTGGDCEDPEAPSCPEGEVCNCPPGYVGTYPECFPPALPTCDDKIQNGDETGVDTGGSCDGPSCVDKIQNQDETGVDTGGVCEGAPDPCFNGIQDGDETGIDKGGACGNDPRPNRCKNGIQDGDETGIDSGGSCGDKVTVDIKANPIYVVSPGSSNISWTSTNADTCKVNHLNAETVVLANINKPSGSFKSINLNANPNRTVKVYNYTATCTGKNGSATDTVSVFAFPKLETVKVNLKVEPPKGKKGDIATVSWTSTNATSCESTGGGGTGTSGSFETTTLNSNKTYSVICKGGANTIPGNDTQLVRVKVSNDNTGSGGNGSGSCPEGWLQEDGSCTPTYTCPNGSTGIWPNCKYIVKPISCPTTKGWSGDKWPDCKYTGNGNGGNGGNTGGNNGNPCPTTKGWSGEKWPDCKYIPECPNGWTGTYPNCKFIKECPTGTTGEYPNCQIDNTGGDGNDGNGNEGNGGNNTDGNCPIGYTGNPPTCTANTSCPTGWTGTWPTCTYVGGGDGNGNNNGNNGNSGNNGNNNGGNGNNNSGNGGNNNGNSGNNNTCPNGTTGTWPTCTFSQTCPIGYTGTWPVCTSGPTTNIAHCSNGVQDFGETAIDIGGGCGGVYNSGATCFDNIKNGDETGIDSGGHCGDGPNNNGEYPSCFDNIKNGDETGIDSGGHCGNPNTGTDWVDVIFPDANGTGTTNGNCVNGVCNGTWEGNFPGLNGPFSGSCRAGQYTDCSFTGNCVDGVCTGTWNGNFGGQNGPFIGTINGGLGDGRGLGNNDWLDTVFTGISGEGTLNGECLNGICKGNWKGVSFNKDGPIVGVWNSKDGTGPYIGECKDNICSGTWSGVIPGNNGELLGKWKGDGNGTDNNRELYIGYEGIPDVDDIVRYHEGIEHVFIRRIMINTELARHYGYQKGQNLLHFAWDLAHTFAKEFGYVDNEGKEIRVSQPDVSAYQLRLIGDKLTVYEYYKNKIIDLRERTTVFKNKNSYEYYFTQ